MENQPVHASLMSQLGDALSAQYRFKEAIDAYTKATRISKGRLKEAEAYISELLKHDNI